MTDEFNLVPGTNEEKLLDNILRTAQGEQPQYNLAPNWRIEQYLDAIQKAIAGGGLPPVTASDAGKVLTAQASATKGAVIVPEQTVELNGKTPVELTGVTSFPSDGDVVIVVQRTLPGETDTAVTVSHGTIIINSQDEVYSEGGKYYCKSSQASNRGHTVTLTVYASVQSGVWGAQEPIGKKFVVTLTPTALDYSGTMDKTVAEINAAYEAGQEIWFNIRVAGNVTLMSHVNEIYSDTDYLYPSFQANVMVDRSTFLKAYTGTSSDGTRTSYETMVYTPAT